MGDNIFKESQKHKEIFLKVLEKRGHLFLLSEQVSRHRWGFKIGAV